MIIDGTEICVGDFTTVVFTNYQGCDSIVNVSFNLFQGSLQIAPPDQLDCDSPNVEISATEYFNGPNGEFLYSWNGPFINGPNDQSTVVVGEAGSYCLTVTHINGPFTCFEIQCIDVVGDYDIPNPPILDGDTEICGGEETMFSVSPNGNSLPTNYNWFSPNGNLNFTNIDANTIAVSDIFFDTEICVTAENDCGISAPTCIFVTIFEPTAIISGNATLCEGNGETADITVEFTGFAPFYLEYSIDGVIADPIGGIFTNPFTFTVSEPGNYKIEFVSDSNGCFGQGIGCAEITATPAIEITLPTIINNPTNTAYIVSFEILGGNQNSISVSPPNGTISGTNPVVFTSDPIICGNGYSFEISDGSSCPSLLVEEDIIFCSCSSDAGIMDMTTIQGCDDVATGIFLGNEFLDGNDILVFGLFDQPFGALLSISTTPEFQFNAALSYGTTYFITAIAGNNDGTGLVDMNDPCTDFSNFVGVIFSEPISSSLTGGGTICEGSGETVNLFIEIQGIAPFEVNYSHNGNPQPPITISSTNQNVLAVSEPGLYKIDFVTDANGCSASGDGSCVEVISTQPVQIQNVAIDENVNNTLYVVSFEIIGDPTSISIIPNNGTLSGTNPVIFTSLPIACGTGFSFSVSDNGGCPPVIVEQMTHFCECDTEVGLMDETLIEVDDGNLAIGIYLGGEVLDSNDVLNFGLFEQPFNFPFSLAITPEFIFDPATMDYGKIYYMAALAGNEDSGGIIDVSDPCLAISNFVEVIFYANATGVPPPNSLMGNTNNESLDFGNEYQKDFSKEAEMNFKIFPNPATDQLFIHSNHEQLIQVELFDFNGKLVKQVVVNSLNYEMNLENLPAGVYLIKMKTASKVWMETVLKM